jgi:hypothetical protein
MSDNFDPKEFLHLADELLKNDTGKREVISRTIVNRSYYAALLFAREFINSKDKNLLDNRENTEDKKSIHWRVREGLKKIGQRQPSKMLCPTSDFLYQLFKQRGDADYNISLKVGNLEAMRATSLSRKIIDNLKRWA